jgi:hypothetical protein
MVHLPDTSFSSDQLSLLTEAVGILEKVFPGYDVRIERANGRHQPPAPQQSAKPIKQSAAPATGVTMRGLVLNATSGSPATVEQVSTATGLEKKKIRGVLNSPDLNFDKIQANGVTAYKFVGMSNKRRKESAE